MTSPFFAAGAFLLGCTAAVLPAGGSAAALETLAVAVMEGFAAAAGFGTVDAGLDVKEPAAGLKGNKQV